MVSIQVDTYFFSMVVVSCDAYAVVHFHHRLRVHFLLSLLFLAMTNLLNCRHGAYHRDFEQVNGVNCVFPQENLSIL